LPKPSAAANDPAQEKDLAMNKLNFPSCLAWALAALTGIVLLPAARAQSPVILDPSFAIEGPDSTVWAVALQTNGQVVIAGDFNSIDQSQFDTRNNIFRLARLNATGVIDTNFNVGNGPNNTVFAAAITTNGQILIGGNFIAYDGTPRGRIARINSNGSLDTAFNTGSGADGFVKRIVLQADGRALITGAFSTINGTNRSAVARLLTSGALDPAFNPVLSGPLTVPPDVAVQPDGRILIAGSFTQVNGTNRSYLARLNADGTLDDTFTTPTINDAVNRVGLLPDGRIVIAGLFTTVSGAARPGLALLHPNGLLDTSFATDGPPNPTSFETPAIQTLEVQADGRILVAGNFDAIGSVSRVRLARLLTNGVVDADYGHPTAGPGSIVRSMAVLPDGRVVIGGDFTAVEGDNSRKRIARLNPSPGTVQFATNAFSAAENAGVAQLTVTRTGGDLGAIDLAYTTSGGTASPGVDYDGAAGLLTLAAGQTNATISIPLLDDDLAESNETFTVRLYVLTAPARAGTITNATVAITENDSRIQFTQAEYGVGEDAGAVTLSVTRSGSSAGAAAAAYTTLDGAALATADYGATSGFLNWADGELGTKSFTVAISNNAAVDGDRSFFVALTNVTGAATAGPRTGARVTVIDDESPLGAQFESLSYSVGESDGAVQLVVRRTGGSVATPATVSFATSNGTAVAGTDYSNTTGLLTFTGPVVSQTVTVPILDDFPVEGDETFTVRLHSPSGLALGSASNATVTIRDTAWSFVDLYGHSLRIEMNEVLGTGDFDSTFTNRLTIRNPSPSASSTGYVAVSGINVGTNRFVFPSIPAGGATQVIVSGTGNYVFQGTNFVIGTVFEASATNDVAQDSQVIYITYGTSPPSGGPPSPGPGISAPGFSPPPTLTSLSVNGPALVDEGNTADFTATALYSNGATNTVGVNWLSSAFAISPAGRLTTAEVAADTAVSVSASFAYGGAVRAATGAVTVVNLVPLSLAAQSRSNGQFQLLLRGTTGRSYRLEAVTNLNELSNWVIVATNLVPVNGVIPVTDATGSNLPVRFYRGRVTP
jgi:uncharacterized delta-60 repeat protein